LAVIATGRASDGRNLRHPSARSALLNDLLGLGLPETTLTEHLDPKLRQASLSSLLVDLLGLWAAERPLLVVLDDAQWLDSLSWQLALQVARSLTELPLLLVLALYRQINYRRGEATNLSHLGNVYHYLGDYQAARTYDLEALAIRRMIGGRGNHRSHHARKPATQY
jgi:hypothetical protein